MVDGLLHLGEIAAAVLGNHHAEDASRFHGLGPSGPDNQEAGEDEENVS